MLYNLSMWPIIVPAHGMSMSFCFIFCQAKDNKMPYSNYYTSIVVHSFIMSPFKWSNHANTISWVWVKSIYPYFTCIQLKSDQNIIFPLFSPDTLLKINANCHFSGLDGQYRSNCINIPTPTFNNVIGTKI